MTPHYRILFLCTGNSARSIMAEAILNQKGKGRFLACSAGSHPTGQPRPEALRQLEIAGISTAGLRSKSWSEFTAADAPPFDCVITVCDHAAREPCPYWPNAPLTAHWGIPDPAAVRGSAEEQNRAFHHAFLSLEARINLLLALPLDQLARQPAQNAIAGIGRLPADQAG